MSYDWTINPNYVPRKDLYAWHQYDPLTSADGVVNDFSGHGRHYGTAANKSVLTLDVLNGQPGWYFDGTSDPMLYDSLSTFKHIFILARADEAVFSVYRGLLSDKTATTLLVGNQATNKFLDLTGEETFDYYKSQVFYEPLSQFAPMAGNAAVIELQIPTGVTMDAIQIGKQRIFERRWKGYFFEDIIYSEIKNAAERQRIYEYFAMRYQVWSMTVDGLDLFPFAANRTRAVEIDIENYQSTPYNGQLKALVRGTDVGDYDLPYLLREQAEFDAATEFFKQHRPVTPFAIRDYRFCPAKEIPVRFTSSLREQGSDVTYRFNYTFGVHEIGSTEVPTPPIVDIGQLTDDGIPLTDETFTLTDS
jgi:hypothetical protein